MKLRKLLNRWCICKAEKYRESGVKRAWNQVGDSLIRLGRCLPEGKLRKQRVRWWAYRVVSSVSKDGAGSLSQWWD